MQSAAFALSNLARGEQIIAEEMLQAGIVPSIISLLTPGHSSIDVASEVAWMLSYLTSKSDCVAVFVSGGIIAILISLLGLLAQEKPHNSQAVTPMLRSLGKSAIIMSKTFLMPFYFNIFFLNFGCTCISGDYGVVSGVYLLV